VGAALLPHDFGYGNKVLTERARIAAAARDGVPRVQVAAQAGTATKIAMADAQRRSPGAIASTSVKAASPMPARDLAPAADAKESKDAKAAKSTTEALTGSGSALPTAVDGPAALAPASPSLPAQASEPRASSSGALDASVSLREL